MRGGARVLHAKVYSLYIERAAEGANEADGAFSAASKGGPC